MKTNVVFLFRITAYFSAVVVNDVLAQSYSKFTGSFPVKMCVCRRYLCCKQTYYQIILRCMFFHLFK